MPQKIKHTLAALALVAAGGAQAALIQMYDTNLTGANLDSVSDALGVIAASSGPDFSANLPFVDFAGDSFPGAGFGAPPNDSFVMRVTGTIDTSQFGYLRVQHDDGFQISIDGGVFFGFDGNTAPTFTNSGALPNLGVVSFEMIYWDQGGDQVAQVLGCNGSDTACLLAQIGDPASNDVPLPGTLALTGLGLLALGASTRRRVA